MTDRKPELCVYILAKNEARNIGRCLESLRVTGWKTVVLDSGSVDETISIVSNFDFAELRPYRYVNHCVAYNEITSVFATDWRYVLVLDADMVVSEELQHEIKRRVSDINGPEVLEAEILMYVDGQPLPHGSLCPPKACIFATGKQYFEATGHGERLTSDVVAYRTTAPLIHDDRKEYSSYLLSQLRYAKNLNDRTQSSQYSFRDQLRTKSPLLVFAVPFVSYILKCGFASGRAGALYAMDRMIAEAIMYRQALASRSSSDQ